MALAEQHYMNLPDGYDPTIGAWVWMLTDCRRRTLHILDGITPVLIDKKIAAGGETIGTLLYHLVAIEMSYLYEDILGLEWADELAPLLIYDVRNEQGELTPVLGESPTVHLNRLAAGRELMLKTLRGMDAESFRQTRMNEGSPISPEWCLYHLMQHEAEHRSQIAGLLTAS